MVKGIDLVAGGRSKALVADRQASMTHYIWRPRRTRKDEGDRNKEMVLFKDYMPKRKWDVYSTYVRVCV